MTITVYSTNHCGQCLATKRALESRGVNFGEVDLDVDSAARAFVMQQLGYRQAPVVVTDSDHWSGFRPDKIAAL